MWIAATELPVSPGHPFYVRLNEILDPAGFDRFVEEHCQPFYAVASALPGFCGIGSSGVPKEALQGFREGGV